MILNKSISVIFTLLLCVGLNAQQQQSFEEKIKSDPLLSSMGMFHYRAENLADTPAPKGYSPVYISHIGRHGSRYPGRDSGDKYRKALNGVDSLAALGELSYKGLQFLVSSHHLFEEFDGNWEKLTPRGAAEHQAIASRMVSRFPEVFKKDSVDVFSTEARRVMDSRDNFLLSLQDCAGTMRIYSKVSNKDKRAYAETKGYHHKKGGPARPNTYPKELRTLKDDAAIRALFLSAGSKAKLNDIRSLFRYYPYRNLLEDFSKYPYIEDEIPIGEYIYVAAQRSNGNTVNYGMTENFVSQTVTYGAVGIAEKIVEDADRALAENNLAATLRFSHDTRVTPLAFLLAVSGVDKLVPATQAYTCEDYLFYGMMASNMQMVFYKNHQSKVLVKILWNEKEVTIPALKPFKGPYYKWEVLRSYIQDRCKQLSTSPTLP